MARGADGGAVGILIDHAPAAGMVAVPVGSFVQVAEMSSRCGAAVGAAGPFAVNLIVTGGAVVQAAALRGGIDPVELVLSVVRPRRPCGRFVGGRNAATDCIRDGTHLV